MFAAVAGPFVVVAQTSDREELGFGLPRFRARSPGGCGREWSAVPRPPPSRPRRTADCAIDRFTSLIAYASLALSRMPAIPRGRTSRMAMMKKKLGDQDVSAADQNGGQRFIEAEHDGGDDGAAHAAKPAAQRDADALDHRRQSAERRDVIGLRQQDGSQTGQAAGDRHDVESRSPHADADDGGRVGIHHHGADLKATPARLHPSATRRRASGSTSAHCRPCPRSRPCRDSEIFQSPKISGSSLRAARTTTAGLACRAG